MKIRWKAPGREVPGEDERQRVRRITNEMRLYSLYRSYNAKGKGADPKHVEEAMEGLINYWGSGGPESLDHPFWAEMAKRARRVTRSADAITAKAKRERVLATARELGIVIEEES